MTPLSWEKWIERVEGGGHRVLAPARPVRAAFKLYLRSTAVTEYKEFAGRSHFLVGEPGWEEVADYALDWAVAHAATPAAV
jgi:hypothetical protein